MITISLAISSSTRLAKMSFYNGYLFNLSFMLVLLLRIDNAVSKPDEHKTYIVHMDHSLKPSSFSTHETWHRAILRSLSKPEEKLLYSYNHVMHGFSARLTPSQASEIMTSPAHIAIHEEKSGKLFTTHSPQFMGLRHSFGLWNVSSYGEGVIVGMIDSGVWPESESFNEKGMPQVPSRWKGKCHNSTLNPFPCNKKLIGAQVFIKGSQAAGEADSDSDSPDDSPRDFLGHGTHTSSTAAGNHVHGASQFGYAKGVARGMAPRAHVAMYKVSTGGSIVESDVLAAMDQAIADGVDIMSLSLGFYQRPYFEDIIAVASLSAVQKGIVVVCSAGNDGEHNSTHNAAPWITTVGAGTLDRSFIASVTLGNNFTFLGKSEFPNRVIVLDTPLYYGKGYFHKTVCSNGALNASEVFGKVVICDSNDSSSLFDQAEELLRVNAAAGILITDQIDPYVGGLSVPCLVLPSSSGAFIRAYAIEAPDEARVQTMRFVLTSFGKKPAPQVADFSSRGPDPINPNILKPDIIAPGVDVLAAFPPSVPVQTFGNYELASDYALLSGTSMSAPHVAGVVALLKAVHPEWSPAAIRSALMTTAYTMDNNGTTITNQPSNLPGTPLDYGAGHIDPNKAMNPGLIYDIDWQGYVDFLCGLGYNDNEMRAILRQSQWTCNQNRTDINYPSIVAMFKDASSPNVKNFTRIVTNVGDDRSIYQATTSTTTRGMKITVEPATLTFTNKYQKQNYVVSVQMDGEAPPVAYGYIKWVDQYSHVVKSPVVVLNQ